MSQANEIVSKGLAVFALAGGDPKEAIVTAVNFGRDTDCLAAVAGGLAGALSGALRPSSSGRPEGTRTGAGAIPPVWTAQVDEATREDPYTNCRRTIDETADGLHAAFVARRKRLADYVDAMGGADFLGG